MKTILIIFLFISSLSSFAAEQASVWGKIIKVNNSKNLKDQYFIYYKQDGKDYAYPINTDLLSQKNLAKQLGTMVRIEGKVVEKTIKTDGPEVKTLVFLASKITSLGLKDLQVTNQLDPLPKNLHPKNEYKGGITIPDSIANMAILTGGAAILGTIIKEQLDK